MRRGASQGAGGPGFRRTVLRLASRRLATRHGAFELHLFRDLASGRIAMALARGDLSKRDALLARVHSSCVTSECLMGCDCDCADQLSRALAAIDRAGRGLVVYLMQEGRGAGLAAKARDRMLVQASGQRMTTFDAYAAMGLPADLRRYDALPSILALLGVSAPLRLMTNNPEKRAAVASALASEKIEVETTVALPGRGSPFNRDYLHAKRRSGHTLSAADPAPGERPPERVRVFEPVCLDADPGQRVTASYFLPIALAAEVVWFRATVVVDADRGRESMVLSRERWTRPEALAWPEAGAWIELGLLDRLPVRDAVGRAALEAALLRIAAGSGHVGLLFPETLETAEAAETARAEAEAGDRTSGAASAPRVGSFGVPG